MSTYVSLERYKRLVGITHAELSKHEDGLTAWELHKILDVQRGVLTETMKNNLLFYVDRWQIAASSGAPQQVWMAAKLVRHEDCPRPEGMK